MHHAARPPRVLNTIPAHLSVTLSVPGVLTSPRDELPELFALVVLWWYCGVLATTKDNNYLRDQVKFL